MTDKLINAMGKIAIDADPICISYLTDNSWTQKTVKADDGRLYGLSASNNSSSNIFLKVYNKGTSITAASDVPVLRALIPPGGREIKLPIAGAKFSAGIGFILCTGAADSDATAVGSAVGSVNAIYGN